MKTGIVAQLSFVLLAVAGLAVSSGCPSAGTGGGVGGGGTAGDDTNDVLAGQVSSLAAKPIAGAVVSLSDGRSSSTDDNGFYSFDGLSAGSRVVVSFRAAGFASTSRAFVVGGGPGCVLMAEAAETVTISADVSSTQRSGDSAVTLAAGSLVDGSGTAVTGDVELTATFLDPSTGGVMAFPGSFEDAETAAGGATTLESFGFAIYELSQNGEEVNLAPGSSADIEYLLPDNAQDRFAVGDTIPLWEFVAETAVWEEAGTGTIGTASDGSGRLAWFATVDHFSSWNCDAPLAEKSCLSGRIVFGDGPVSGAEVAAVGLDYNGTSVVRSGGDGTFCVEVKRGSSVRLEVRLNGSATPVVTREVVASDTPADCTTGTCTEVGDVSVSLDSCVFGTVLHDDGTPASGVTVFVVPGGTTTTGSDGSYYAAAVGGQEVFVFSQGRPSVSVQTSVSASCGGSICAQADLLLTLPGDGDDVGELLAQTQTILSDITGESAAFALRGSFLVADSNDLASAGLTGSIFPGVEMQTQEVGGCTVTTQTFTFSSDGVSDPTFSFDFGGLGALDPGEPGTATNGTASVTLLRGDPNLADPPAPSLAGIFSPGESPEELVALGFEGGQTIDFSFPGGADLGPFSASIDIPDDIVVTSPDLSASALTLNTSRDWDITWVTGSPTDTVVVTLTQSTVDNSDGSVSSTVVHTTILCKFADDGTGTIPALAMSMLPAESATGTTTVTFSRERTVSVSVPLRRVAGEGVVNVVGSASVSKTFTAFSIPDLPAIPDLSDLCSFITCPAGEVCNPDTLQCEPQ